MKQIELVEILWLDAADLEPGWGYIEELKELDENELTATYGLFAGEDEFYIYHASTYNPDSGEFAGRAQIPKGIIHSISTIEVISYEI